MEFFIDLFSNRILMTAVTAWFIAQVLKTCIHIFLTKELVLERLIGSGGMPSSHSATVCALAASCCYVYGPGSFEFAVTLIMAIIVMHDAMGVRRETGIQARLLNEMMKIFEEMGKGKAFTVDTLKEFVGHTPLQVLMGAILGILVAVIMFSV